MVRQGIVYIGLICAIEAVYENQMYRLVNIIDLTSSAPKQQSQQVILHNPPLAYRVLLAKGPFYKNDGK